MSQYTIQFIQDLRKLSQALSGIVQDVAVMSADQFDQNFENQSFFGKPWKPSKYVERENAQKGKRRRNLLQNKGHLRKSINYGTAGDRIIFYSNLTYASIHNEGGTINHPGGTAYAYDKKKKRPIWISNRKATDKYKRTKPHLIKIPQRQFIGNHKLLEKMIEEHVEMEVMKHFR